MRAARFAFFMSFIELGCYTSAPYITCSSTYILNSLVYEIGLLKIIEGKIQLDRRVRQITISLTGTLYFSVTTIVTPKLRIANEI